MKTIEGSATVIASEPPVEMKTNFRALEVMGIILRKFPSLRIGQLIGNVVPSEVAERMHKDFYYLPDEELLGYLEDYAKRNI
jgi:hypothetical protein